MAEPEGPSQVSAFYWMIWMVRDGAPPYCLELAVLYLVSENSHVRCNPSTATSVKTCHVFARLQTVASIIGRARRVSCNELNSTNI